MCINKNDIPRTPNKSISSLGPQIHEPTMYCPCTKICLQWPQNVLNLCTNEHCGDDASYPLSLQKVVSEVVRYPQCIVQEHIRIYMLSPVYVSF